MAAPEGRFQLLYELARSITTFTELDPLLRFATRRARELLRAEGCAVLLLDRRRGELFFPVASQAASHEAAGTALEETSFPQHAGVAGWVLREGRALEVDDAASDPRFYSAVDRVTGITTRAILCAPMKTRAGQIGVVEVINLLDGRFAPEDLEFLEALAADIAVACEKVRLYDRLRDEMLDLRKVCRLPGLGLATMGIVFAAGATYSHLAWALPLRERVAAGLRCRLGESATIAANATLPLNNDGLHADIIPTVDVEYAF